MNVYINIRLMCVIIDAKNIVQSLHTRQYLSTKSLLFILKLLTVSFVLKKTVQLCRCQGIFSVDMNIFFY